jgi:hypothetical protein
VGGADAEEGGLKRDFGEQAGMMKFIVWFGLMLASLAVQADPPIPSAAAQAASPQLAHKGYVANPQRNGMRWPRVNATVTYSTHASHELQTRRLAAAIQRATDVQQDHFLSAYAELQVLAARSEVAASAVAAIRSGDVLPAAKLSLAKAQAAGSSFKDRAPWARRAVVLFWLGGTDHLRASEMAFWQAVVLEPNSPANWLLHGDTHRHLDAHDANPFRMISNFADMHASHKQALASFDDERYAKIKTDEMSLDRIRVLIRVGVHASDPILGEHRLTPAHALSYLSRANDLIAEFAKREKEMNLWRGELAIALANMGGLYAATRYPTSVSDPYKFHALRWATKLCRDEPGDARWRAIHQEVVVRTGLDPRPLQALCPT